MDRNSGVGPGSRRHVHLSRALVGVHRYRSGRFKQAVKWVRISLAETRSPQLQPPPGSHGVDGDPASPIQPAGDDHGQLMNTHLESRNPLPTSLVQPSQRRSVAAHAKLMFQQHTDTGRRNPRSQPAAPIPTASNPQLVVSRSASLDSFWITGSFIAFAARALLNRRRQ